MLFALYALSFLIIILIGILASKKFRKIIGRIYEFILKAMPVLFYLLVALMIIALVISFAISGWSKLHELFPRMWSVSDIIGVTLTFLIVGFVAYLSGTNKFNKMLAAESNKAKRMLVKELYVLIGIAVAWIVIVLPQSNGPTSISLIPYQLASWFWLFGYPLCLLVRLFIWVATRRI